MELTVKADRATRRPLRREGAPAPLAGAALLADSRGCVTTETTMVVDETTIRDLRVLDAMTAGDEIAEGDLPTASTTTPLDTTTAERASRTRT